LATLFGFVSHPQKAEPLLQRALAMREKLLPAGHRDIALSLSNLGLLYLVQGRCDEAEPLLERALAILEKAQPANDLEIGFSLHHLAALYQAQGRFASAMQLTQRAMPILGKMESPGDPGADPDAYHAKLCLVLEAQNRVADAERRALAVSAKRLSPLGMILGMMEPGCSR